MRVGDLVWDKEEDYAKPENIAVESVLPHPKYQPQFQYNDIGLVKLRTNIEFNSFVRPACLSSDFGIKEIRAIASGWGSSQWFIDSNTSLMSLQLSPMTHNRCSLKFSNILNLPNGFDETMHICARNPAESDYPCGMESGSPLQVYHNLYCMYKLVGVTSSPGCLEEPTLFTRVSHYVNWIEANVFEDG